MPMRESSSEDAKDRQEHLEQATKDAQSLQAVRDAIDKLIANVETGTSQ